ncbi:hypothetical protein RB195_000989 [Necator americanus]|uniref:Reverse transcriptase domain-containing protein n=1 Tax=Necator americanus TaxID=51031 RepID=A0ABR1DC64_NECAM
MRDGPVISIENYTIYCGDADENKVRGGAIAVRNGYKNLVEEFKSTSPDAPLYDCGKDSKDAFDDELSALISKVPNQQLVIVRIDADEKMRIEQQSDVLGKWYYPVGRTSDNGDRLVDLCKQRDLIITSTFKRNHRRHQLTWQVSTVLTSEEQRKRNMRTLKLQLDYVLARNIPQSDVRKSRAVWDVSFYSDHRPVHLSLKIRFHKRNRGVLLQPKINMADLKDEECRKKSRQRVSIHVGVRTRKKLSDADFFKKSIQDAAKETLQFYCRERSLLLHRKPNPRTILRKLRRQLQQDRDNEWSSRAMEFEKAWEDRNPRKAYALQKQYSSKMKRCSSVLNTANGVAVGGATLPIWREHFKTLLNRQAPSSPELECVHRLTYAVNEEPPTESEVLVCIQKMKNGKSGGDDVISAEMLKYLPPLGFELPRNLFAACYVQGTGGLSLTDSLNIAKKQRATSKLAFVLADLRLTSRVRLYLPKPSSQRARADEVPGKFVRLLDDMNQRTTAAVRTPAGCTTPFEVVTGVRQEAVAGPFLLNFAIEDTMLRTVDRCLADIILGPSGRSLTDLEYADDVVIFAESNTKV